MTNRSTDEAAKLEAANLFSRAAHWLEDYAVLATDAEIGEDDMVDELHALAIRLRELCGEWEEKRTFGDGKNAAWIVLSMLREWKLPGAVWYHPGIRRFRLVGEGYEASEDELLVGVYLPSVTPQYLIEDFEAVLA